MRRVNVDGVIHATRAVIGSMRARRYGRIVNVSSIAAIGTALPGNAFYAAVKAEVLALTRRFAFELGPHGITVNAVAPGFVRTDMTQGGRGAADWPGTERNMAARAMLSRIAKCEGRKNWAEINPELVREAKRLRRRSPKGHRRSLRDVAAELAKLGFVNERGSRFSPSSIASITES